MPTCNRARENAAHTSVSDGISIIGVGNVSTTGGRVGEGVKLGASVGGGGVEEGVGVFVDADALGVGDSVGGGGVDEEVDIFVDADALRVGDSVGGGGVDEAAALIGGERGEASITG